MPENTIIIDDITKNALQAYTLGKTTRGNPDLPAAGPIKSRMALLPALLGANTAANGVIISAINELFTTITSTNNIVNNFNTRINKLLGDEEVTNKEDWENAQLIAANLTRAILVLNNEIDILNDKLTSVTDTIKLGSMTLSDLEESL